MWIGWTGTWVAIPLLVGTGMNALSYSPPDFLLARGCFIVAAIVLVGMTTVWLRKNWPPSPAQAIGAVAFYVLAVLGLTGSMIYVSHREAAAQVPPGSVSGSCIAFGNNNSLCNSYNFGPVPRDLNNEQLQEIAVSATSAGASRLVVHYDIPCQDCVLLARKIILAFETAKWKVTDSSAIMSLASALPGINIGVKDDTSINKDDRAVSNALAAGHISHSFAKINKTESNVVDLFVGAQPMR